MATPAQFAANRVNAQNSTGPVTAEGKAAVAGNARKHGLAGSTFALLPNEDPGEFKLLLLSLTAEHLPATPTETFLVEEMAQAQWRLRRIAYMEAELLARSEGADVSPALLRLNRYESSARRAWYRALNQLIQLRKQLPRQPEPEVPRPIPVPAQGDESKPMPAHLERELAAHRRRDPFFDPHRDRSQMSKALQKYFS